VYRTLSALALGCLLFGCSEKKDKGGPPEPVKPAQLDPPPTFPPSQVVFGMPPPQAADFMLTAEDYFKERDANPKAAREKYAGKVVEISATLWDVTVRDRFWTANVVAGEDPRVHLPVIKGITLYSPVAGGERDLRLLSCGQRVTIRATGNAGPGEVLLRANIDGSGPTTAKVTTLAEVGKVLASADPKEKYKNTDVLVRAKLVETGKKDSQFVGTVTDPDATVEPRFLLKSSNSPVFQKELEALKPGDVVTILGVPRTEYSQSLIENPRIVTDPPAGLKLPGDKR